MPPSKNKVDAELHQATVEVKAEMTPLAPNQSESDPTTDTHSNSNAASKPWSKSKIKSENRKRAKANAIAQAAYEEKVFADGAALRAKEKKDLREKKYAEELEQAKKKYAVQLENARKEKELREALEDDELSPTGNKIRLAERENKEALKWILNNGSAMPKSMKGISQKEKERKESSSTVGHEGTLLPILSSTFPHPFLTDSY